MRDVTNTFNSNTQLTMGVPGHNTSQSMLVLDMEVWIRLEDGIPLVRHSFYKKAVTSMFTIPKRYVISEEMIKSTIFQEGLRRLSHVSPAFSLDRVCDTQEHMVPVSQGLRLWTKGEVRCHQRSYPEAKEDGDDGEGRLIKEPAQVQTRDPA